MYVVKSREWGGDVWVVCHKPWHSGRERETEKMSHVKDIGMVSDRGLQGAREREREPFFVAAACMIASLLSLFSLSLSLSSL